MKPSTEDKTTGTLHEVKGEMCIRDRVCRKRRPKRERVLSARTRLRRNDGAAGLYGY